MSATFFRGVRGLGDVPNPTRVEDLRASRIHSASVSVGTADVSSVVETSVAYCNCPLLFEAERLDVVLWSSELP